MSKEKQNDELVQMYRDLAEIFDEEYEKRRLITPQNAAEKMTAKGYHKQSEGEWVTVTENWVYKVAKKYCSNCGVSPRYNAHLREYYLTNYCPHCGAKMKGGAE